MENKGVNDIMSRYLQQLTDPNVAARRGSSLALGILPFEFLAKGWKSVITKLCSACGVEVYACFPLLMEGISKSSGTTSSACQVIEKKNTLLLV